MKRSSMFVAALVLALGCGGGGEEPTSDGSSGSEDPSAETCEGYGASDSCMGDDAFAQCQAAAAQCPGEVLQMESCPLQFACPDDGSASTDNDTCEGHTTDESCMGDDAFAACQAAAARCPGAVTVLETCPLRFTCG
ncbi:MAG: hypothetical protein AB7S26_21160 [Sandaracinaceae bacterium]